MTVHNTSPIEMYAGGVRGSAEYSKKDKCWHGQILGITDSITYESDVYDRLYIEFYKTVLLWHKDRLEIMGGQK